MAVTEELIIENQKVEPPKIIDPDKQIEYVDGSPEVKEMAGAKHSGVGTRLIIEMGIYIKANNLGRIYGPDATFAIGNNERIPDISFVSASRIPPEGEPLKGWNFAPDLAVEIVSPNDLYVKVHNKIREYFAAGVKEVWLVSPEEKTVTVYSSPKEDKVLTQEDVLTSEELLPGFNCPLSEIFIDP